MRVRFQADADLDGRIGKGVRRRYPQIDFRLAYGVIPDGTPDPDVLLLAARENRVLVSGDLATMGSHFSDFIREHDSPGLILIPRNRGIRQAIEDLFNARTYWPTERLRNQLLWASDIYKDF